MDSKMISFFRYCLLAVAIPAALTVRSQGKAAITRPVYSAIVAPERLPPNFYLKTLSNGLQVLVIEDHTVPIFNIEIAVKNGSYTESPAFNGLSHLYEHMFFKANKRYPSQEAFLARINELGMDFNGTTSEERVNYFFTTQKIYLEEGIEFMADAVQFPLFSAPEMKKENVVVDGEFQRQESSPGHFLYDTLNRALWGTLYSRKNVIGNHQVILTATPEKMKIIQEKYYVPNNSLLTVAGDVSHEVAFALVEKNLGGWASSGKNPHTVYPEPAFTPIPAIRYIVIDKSIARTPIIALAWHGPSVAADPESTYCADVFSAILSQNSSSLQQKLVNSGLALSASISYSTLAHTGPVELSVDPNPDKIPECLAMIKAELFRFAAPDYFTDEQLAKAKSEIVIGDAYTREQSSVLIHEVSYYWCSGGLGYYAGYLNHIGGVSRADIQHYLRKYIIGKPYIAAMILSPELRKSSNADLFFKP